MTALRLAGAPISWGVCEVPGWGHQLDADRVLDEMVAVGITAAEFGPDGFLAPGALARHGLAAVGGFVPVVLHDPSADAEAQVARQISSFAAAGAEMLVLAAATGADGYDSRPDLDDVAWKTLLSNLDRLAEVAAAGGLRAVLHPHVGTMIENRDDVWRVLDGSSIPLCLDTGHLLIGGSDPVELATQAADRIAHAHLKDVDLAQLGRVTAGELSYSAAVAEGLYRPLGAGDVDIAAVVSHLRGAGYDGWWVLEQDTVLDGEPAGDGPVADVRASIEYLHTLVS
ncbi:sugar phosphate isomerase/epimerase family protein [Williamsia maris]|uniref:Inosose dehydratase n=1 Tax=Williamsia maris TaxID=72806 RepID=A0ABT1HGY2_9NOCA|nr:sugar phosphate isomerase/epimerase [Williamsia maris]MCP2177505.1 inosose dehydratase [Williamsia maris]